MGVPILPCLRVLCSCPAATSSTGHGHPAVDGPAWQLFNPTITSTVKSVRITWVPTFSYDDSRMGAYIIIFTKTVLITMEMVPIFWRGTCFIGYIPVSRFYGMSKPLLLTGQFRQSRSPLLTLVYRLLSMTYRMSVFGGGGGKR